MNSQIIDSAIAFGMDFGPKIVGAVVTLIIGLWVVRKITSFVRNRLVKSNFDATLTPFIANMVSMVLKVLLVISVAGIVGIKTTSFVAVLGAATFAVGMALQGSLGNFAGGVLILIFRPFKVGSYIKAQGHEGVVDEILLFVTVLRTLDNQIIYLPNGALAGGAIQNLNQEATRRVDMTFGIGYGDSIDDARTVFKETMATIPEILQSPAPDIIVTELADSSVNFSIRPWCKSEDYWTVFAACHEKIKKALDKKGISIPFPQSDVYMHQVNS